MKKISVFLLVFYCSVFLSGCDTVTPQKYFDVAVLNTNRIVGFAGTMMSRELETTSTKADEKGQIMPMKRQEVIDDYIQFAEEMLDRLDGFGKNEDAAAIVNSSKALYSFMLPVYKKEYTELAKLYDESAPKEKTAALDAQIKEQYGPKFEELYKDLISKGKLYAAKHGIAVNWAE